jgi:hypothetical protein
MLDVGRSRWLDSPEVRALLGHYGLPLVDERLVATATEASEAAGRLGFPVALKGIAPSVIHKSDLRGVHLGLATPEAVVAAAREIEATFASAGHSVERFLVQRMASSGAEMLVGVVHDRLFGPVVACAAGGTEAELLKDVAVRITPLTDVDAAEMVRSLATFPLLEGRCPRTRGRTTPRQRDGRDPSRDRRDGPQPGHRPAHGSRHRRRQDPDRGRLSERPGLIGWPGPVDPPIRSVWPCCPRPAASMLG